MTDKARVLETALAENNFALVRTGKHRVYRNPEGKTLVTAATPSDVRASEKQLRDLRHLLNASPEPAAREDSDAAIPKCEKGRPGRAQPANVFNFYEGFASPSVPATPEATLRALRGYLQSKQSYKFKSEFLKEITRFCRDADQARIAAMEACLRDFAEMRGICEEHLATHQPLDARLLPDLEQQKWRTFDNNLKFVLEILESKNKPIHLDDLLAKTRNVLRVELRLSKTDAPARRAALTNMCGRVANRLLRGDSAQHIREFVEPQVRAIQDRFNFDFNFDFHALIEKVAAEKGEVLS